MNRHLLSAALLLSLTSCARDSGSSSLLEAASQSRKLAQYALDQLPDLRNGVSLSVWRKSHARDNVTLYAPSLAEQTNENWCVRATAEVTLDSNRNATRSAYFYPPAAPDALTLPSGIPAGTLVHQCRLGLIWIEAAEGDFQRARILSDQTRESISASLGPADTGTRLLWWNSASWRNGSLWKSGDLAVVAAMTTEPGRDTSVPERPTRVFVAGAGEQSGINFEWDDWVAGRSHQRLADQPAFAHSRIQEAIVLAGLGGDVERSMRFFLGIFAENAASPRSPTAQEEVAFADAIDQWLLRSRNLPAARRAAALVAADQLLRQFFETSTDLGDPSQPTLRKRFAAHGAAFEYAALGGWFSYTRTWLKEALNIAPESRAGEIAFLTLMEMGFETSPTCKDQGAQGFRAVIARGAQHLRDKPGSAISTDVHFMIAEAYSDIVTLANGGGYENLESAAYIAEAPAARARAIEAYQTAFARSGASAKARESWANAWRLMAHLTPTRTFFYCVYD